MKTKVITICGSTRYSKEMMEIAHKMNLNMPLVMVQK